MKKFVSRLGIAAVVAALSLIPGRGNIHADSGTITTTNTTYQYTHGPFLVANPTGAAGAVTCGTGNPCDDTTLYVNVPAGTDTSNQIKVTINWPMSTADFDLYVLDASGNTIASSATSSDPETTYIPAVSGTYTIRVVPFDPQGQSFTGTADLEAKPAQPQPGTGVAPRFQSYHTPGPFGQDAGEPSIGVDVKTGKVLFQSLETTLAVNFDDSTSPAQTTWTPYHPVTAATSLDPIGFLDQRTGRYFESQLTGQDSLTEFTDNDGQTWTPSQGGGIPSGVDHQTIGGGPYHANTLNLGPLTSYPDAVYYCSQDIATAFCARSDNGGLTFGAGVPVYNLNDCGGLHGHVKVAPDGTVYLPNKSCDGHQAVIVSTDNGLTWQIRTIPQSTPGDTDPSVGIAKDGTVYFGYQNGDGKPHIAVSHDQGQTWQYDQAVGTEFGIQNSVFPEVVAGDGNRAAFAFLGTPTGGNYQDTANFQGVWHMYVATTYDGGQTYITTDATPNDPVQRGSICTAGTTCGNDRNLLDFNDITIDAHGNILVGYADGCVTSTCITAVPTASKPNQNQYNDFTAVATISRQSGGRPLYAQYDPTEPHAPARPLLTATTVQNSGVNNLSWQAPDNGGSAITGYTVYRGTSSTTLKVLAKGWTKTTYNDSKIKSGTTFYYAITATNASGTSPQSPAVTPQVVTVQSACDLPGITVATDAAGDQVGAPSLNNDLDLTALDVGEPYLTDGSGKLVFSMQVTDLSSGIAPSRQWIAVFYYGSTRYYARASTDSAGLVSFDYGYLTPSAEPVTPVSLGTAGSGSGISIGTNTVTIVVPTSGLNQDPAHPNGPAAGDQLTGLQARTFAGTGTISVTPDSAVDSTGSGSYTLVGNASCQGK